MTPTPVSLSCWRDSLFSSQKSAGGRLKTQVSFRWRGQVVQASWEAGETLLDCAIRYQLSPPFSCLEGDCGTCQARVSALAEGESKLLLTCQVRFVQTSRHIVVDFDQNSTQTQL